MPAVRCLDDALWAPWEGRDGVLHVMTSPAVPADYVRWRKLESH